MYEKEIYTNSILTFAFTNDGKIVVRKDKNGKIDTLPLIFMGYRDKNSKTDYDDGIWIMNSMDEYEERIATFFAYHLRNSRNAILDGWLIGNKNSLLDVGYLYEKIASYQIQEMKTINTSSYIRVNRGLYDWGTNQNGQKIINKIETRYIVLSSDENIENFPELETKDIEELKGNFSLLSNKMLIGITGEDGKIMESFISKLNSLNKSTSSKK